MRSEKGVTLTSLVIYIIGLTIMICILSMFMNFFYNNVNRDIYADSASEQYTTLVEYISNDINSRDIKIVKLIDNNKSIYIGFNNDNTIHEYIYSDNKINFIEGYYEEKNSIIKLNSNKTIMICKDIEECTFSIADKILTINLMINNKLYSNKFYIKNTNL